MFGEIIRSFRVGNGLSQAHFVEIVQRSNNKFDHLDIGTLSRWERGVTVPHLTRQNELLELIGVNIFDVWGERNDKSLDKIKSKLNNNCYINMVKTVKTEVLIVNSNNLNCLSELGDILDVIFEYEDNFIFHEMINKGLTRQGVIKKIITQYGGEFIVVMVNRQLVGHLLSSKTRIISDLMSRYEIGNNDEEHLIISFNCSVYQAFISTFGREVYKYTQNLNQNSKLYILLTERRLFDILFNLGFEYRSVVNGDISMKLMYSECLNIKSHRVWMNVISKLKREEDEVCINC